MKYIIIILSTIFLSACGGSPSDSGDDGDSNNPAVDATSPGPITNLLVRADNDGVILVSWDNPTDTDFSGVVVRRSAVGSPSTITDGVEAYIGSGTNLVDNALNLNTTSFYSVFSYDTALNFSAATTGNATTYYEALYNGDNWHDSNNSNSLWVGDSEPIQKWNTAVFQ